MTAVQVAKLKLRCEARVRDRVRFAIEDGLRTTVADDRRLTLLRRMRVAGRLGDPAQRQQAVKAGWLAAVAGARHGGEDGADGANCVWFESPEEAESLLLARLLAGRRADGWYWKLAVPDWRGRPLPAWLSASLTQALALGDDRRVLAIARRCIAAGGTERLVEALAEPAAMPSFEAPGDAGRPARPPAPEAPVRGPASEAPAPALVPLPPELRRIVVRLIAIAGDGPAAAQAIVRAWARRHSPALALVPDLLASTVATALAEIRSPQPPAPRAEVAPAPTPSPPSTGRPEVRRGEQAVPLAEDRSPDARQGHPSPLPAPEPGSPPPARRPVPPGPAEQTAPAAYRHSRHAGLWLVLPSLHRLGFREWLIARPALLGDHPGRLLLHAIARRYRIDCEDPALAMLAPPPDGELPEWSEWWRHGLDRWLRRTARRRLHDLVNRPGRLDWDEWRVDIRYPGADADIALRRHALDRDPGWTDWLGLSVRYHFGAPEERP